jgi:hypothetical protein
MKIPSQLFREKNVYFLTFQFCKNSGTENLTNQLTNQQHGPYARTNSANFFSTAKNTIQSFPLGRDLYKVSKKIGQQSVRNIGPQRGTIFHLLKTVSNRNSKSSSSGLKTASQRTASASLDGRRKKWTPCRL